MLKRDKWTEADLDALSPEESDAFDRKSGKLFVDQNQFLDTVAKTLSAFSNSGGGSLVVGVDDNGTPDGIQQLVGRTSIKDWIEQKIPHLLDYSLSDFRVHRVVRSNPSRIPPNREVIVVDVGDSALAPHQSKRDHHYYRREGGRSVAAPHFYLELLRQRLTNAALEFRLTKIDPREFYEHDDGIFLETTLRFEIENVGRVAAFNWQLTPRELNHDDETVLKNHPGYYYFGFANFPVKKGRDSSIPLDRTILPGCTYIESLNVGFQLRPNTRTEDAVRQEIAKILGGVTISYRLATENSPGELVPIRLSPALDVEALLATARKQCLGFFHI